MNYQKIEKLIGYTFQNKEHLKIALTHSSYANENNAQSYEVYEFLGDSLLGFFVSEFLFVNFDLAEGQLTKLRASLVSASSLKNAMEKLDINSEVLIGKSLANNFPNSMLSDIFESLTAAIYLDGGKEQAKSFVYKYLIINREHVEERLGKLNDYKTMLQEKMQAEGKKVEYRVIKKWGKPHDMSFKVGLFINESCMQEAEAKSIKEGEQKCAEAQMQKLNNK